MVRQEELRRLPEQLPLYQKQIQRQAAAPVPLRQLIIGRVLRFDVPEHIRDLVFAQLLEGVIIYVFLKQPERSI